MMADDSIKLPLRMFAIDRNVSSNNCWMPGWLKSIKVITSICCILGFACNSFVIFQHFIENKTVTTMNMEKHSKLFFPSITICNHIGFKEKIINLDGLRLVKYINNTIELKEILESIIVLALDFTSSDELIIETDFKGTNYSSEAWNINTIITKYRGRCYAIHHKKEVNIDIEFCIKSIFP